MEASADIFVQCSIMREIGGRLQSSSRELEGIACIYR
jgi:hypothetical protein